MRSFFYVGELVNFNQFDIKKAIIGIIYCNVDSTRTPNSLKT